MLPWFTWIFRPKLLESSLTCSCSFVVGVVVLSCHFWSIGKTSQIYPQNKSWINHFSPSLPSLVYPCLHHVVLDDGNWLLTSLLSTWCPTVYVAHSSQTKPLKTKSNHIIPLFGTLQKLPNTLRVKPTVLSEDLRPTNVAFGFLSSLISNSLSPWSHTPVSRSSHLPVLLGMIPQTARGLLPIHQCDLLKRAFAGPVSNTASWAFLITFIPCFLFLSSTCMTLHYTFIYLLIYLFSFP